MASEGAQAGPEEDPRVTFLRQLSGGWMAQAIHVAARLGVADLLAPGPQPVSSLAKTTGCHQESLYRLLRSLVPLGFFTEAPPPAEPGTFSLTSYGRVLTSSDGEAEGGGGRGGGGAGVGAGIEEAVSMRNMAINFGLPEHFRSFGNLLHAVRTGESGFRGVFGTSLYEHLSACPESAGTFNQAMNDLSKWSSRAVLECFDFSGIHTLADVAGGEGHLLGEVLAAHPGMQGVLMDQPAVVEGSGKVLGAKGGGVAGRCRVVGGSFFQLPAPPEIRNSADACLLKNVLHNWADREAVKILQYCNSVLKPGGRLLVVEFLVPVPSATGTAGAPATGPSPGTGPGSAGTPAGTPAGYTPHLSTLVDIVMLAVSEGGKERTVLQHGELMRQAGFEVRRVIPLKGEQSIVEAVKVE